MPTKLGQNFLTSQTIAKKIADLDETNTRECIEVGPGKGILTQHLLNKYKRVVAIEKDKDLFEELEIMFEWEIKNRKLVLINADALKQDFSKLTNKKYSIVSNIPYYITNLLIKKFLTQKNKPEKIVLLIQKEVAERIARDKKESVLSLSVKFYGTPKYEKTVKRNSFKPQPKVDSAILSISDLKEVGKKLEERFFQIVKQAFSKKRKKVLNNLKNLISEETLSPFIKNNQRAEEIDLETWIKIANLK